LSNITAPRLARRPNPNVDGMTETKDEPFAWEAREYLRKKLVGKEVAFTVEYKVPGSGREYGIIYIGKDATGENVTEALVAEGLVEVRRAGLRLDNEGQQRLIQLEDAAKAASKGKWNAEEALKHVRDIVWNLENPRHFVDSFHNKPVEAVVEHVRDGCTIRAFILPSFTYVTIMMSGIKSPMFKMEGEEQKAETFAEEAKFFTESRLLQRDVQIILEGVSNQILQGTILHPQGNIQELLVKEGLARCVNWSMGNVTEGADKLRLGEKAAKEKKLRIWKDYSPAANTGAEIKDKSYSAKVVEVVNGDAMVVKMPDNEFKKIFLASIRPPRMSDDPNEEKRDSKARVRPLYDVPYMFEAREFLRKRLIGKKVNIQVDYIQPASQGFPEKTCCTVTVTGIDVGEALVSKGYAKVVRHRQDDENRSSRYDNLLAAETRAEKKGTGMHSKKEYPMHRVADISGDVPKAKQFLPFLQRAGRMEGLVEFVASGSRARLYIPRETCLVTFLLSGISCPRASRPGQGGGAEVPAEPYGAEALLYTKENILQREVEVEVETMDKGGNFIGYMFVDGTNLSVALVEQGFASVHFTAEKSQYFKALQVAESKAKTAKLGIWKNYEEPKEIEVEPENEPQERKVNHKSVLITEVSDDGLFYAQNVDTGPQLEKLMEQLRQDLSTNPPLPGAYTPKRGDLCAAKFVDGEWYRAKVEKVQGNSIHLLYVDYGNREVTGTNNLATLPAIYHTLPEQARQYALACVQFPSDEEAKQDAIDALTHDTLNKQFLLNVEYKNAATECVSLSIPDTKDDVAQSLLADGLVLMELRKERRLAKLVATYQKAQEKAKQSRLNLWRYGDFVGDDAKEFGFN